MGFGSYTSSDWAKLKESRGIGSASSEKDLFKSRSMPDKFNPRFINVRESCDSPDSPMSTPIIIGFDVTGSMGYLAREIAKNALNKTVTEIYEKKPVTDPHVLCAAIGDVCDKAPLQVTQFEADIRIAEQLMDLWLEGGGGDIPESYNLAWYFADKHTRIDSFEKHGRKGFLFTIGDAPTHPDLKGSDISKIFGDDSPNLKNSNILADVMKKYNVFHIVTKTTKESVMTDWLDILPGRVSYISADGISYLAEVIISLMQKTSGMSDEAILSQWAEEANTTVKKALSTIDLDGKKKGSFLDRIFG